MKPRYSMRSILKISAGVVGMLVGIVALCYGIIAIALHLFIDFCSDEVIRSQLSPDQKMLLIVSQLNCGATTSGDTTITLIPSDSRTPREKTPGFVFIRGLHDLPTRWTSDRTIEIILPKDIKDEDVQRSAQNTHGIAIDYK